jgi:outer membrane protein OmpA-like peptidoglycan-associated protein
LLATLATSLLLLVGSDARAQSNDEPFPIDVEMVRPGLSPLGGFQVDAPQTGGRGVWSVGALLQYENSPLRLYDGADLLGPLVAHRNVLQVHGGAAISKRTSLSFMLPVSVHFGAGDTERSANGAGLGDASIGMRVHAGTWGRFSLGVLGTVLLPTGNFRQYMGERLPRLRVGMLGHTDFGRVRLLTNLLAHVRQPVDTGFDFTAASELHMEVGFQATVLPDHLDFIGELVTRVGLARGPSGGRLASEVLAGFRYKPGLGGLRIDLGLGRGLTEGYGTTGIRAMAGLTYVRPAKPPPPPPEPEKVAQLKGEEIVIRDPIEFQVDTTILLTSSDPILDAIAEIIAGNPAIGHVVIEGHASQEGDFAYNYRLSLERARVIYEALVLRGVHPKRLSYRGAGEVEKLVESDDPVEMEKNRRVVFSVVRQYQPGEALPELPTEILLPWSGEAHTTTELPPSVPIPEPEEGAEPAEETPAPAPEPEPEEVDPLEDLPSDEVFPEPDDEAEE